VLSDKTERELGIRFRSLPVMLYDCAEKLIQFGVVNK
jgi:hypothetical protein